ncbi:MAG: glycogen/starch synthase, partial [Bacteroidales bacterium]|nr:glycogen/starch synthase [Bacteroidales bacterium]
KKLGWPPDIVHCHGWMTSLIPIYVKKAFKDNPIFSDTKVVFSIYDDDFSEALSNDFSKNIKLGGVTNKDLTHYKNPNYVNLMKAAIDFSDAVIKGVENINQEVQDYIDQSSKPLLENQSMDNYIDVYNEFYDKILEDRSE